MLPARVARTLGRPTKPLLEPVTGDLNKPKPENPYSAVRIDLVTSSGGGVDPHISQEAAYF